MSTIFDRNLSALKTTYPALASLITAYTPPAQYTIEPTPSGHPTVQHTHHTNGAPPRTIYIHSRRDPQKEAARIIAGISTTDCNCLIFLGFGLGYYIEAAIDAIIENGSTRKEDSPPIFIVDSAPDMVYTACHARNIEPITRYSNLHWLLGYNGMALREEISRHYHPFQGGEMTIIPLRAAIEMNAQYFGTARRTITHTIASLRSDFATQKRFGRRWMHNIVLNLAAQKKSLPISSLPHVKRAIITAGGPSLDHHLHHIAESSHYIVATDTSLATLKMAGISPDIVMMIDCQQVSYLHFMDNLPPHTIVICDIASSPSIIRHVMRTHDVLFCASSHPLIRYLEGDHPIFPRAAMEGGNVTQSAVDLVRQLGAEEIEVIGADWSYKGHPYTRGSALYNYYRARMNRITPFEGHICNFMMENSYTSQEGDPSADWMPIYRTALMDQYQKNFQEYMHTLPPHLTIKDPVKILHASTEKSVTSPHERSGAKNSQSDICALMHHRLSQYARMLENTAVDALPPRLLHPLLPLAFHFAGQGASPSQMRWQNALQNAKAYTMQLITAIARKTADI